MKSVVAVVSALGLVWTTEALATETTATFFDVASLDPASTVCKPHDFNSPGGKGFVGSLYQLGNNSHGVMCGSCVKVHNVANQLSVVVKVVDDADEKGLALSQDAFATIAKLDDRKAEIEYEVVQCHAKKPVQPHLRSSEANSSTSTETEEKPTTTKRSRMRQPREDQSDKKDKTVTEEENALSEERSSVDHHPLINDAVPLSKKPKFPVRKSDPAEAEPAHTGDVSGSNKRLPKKGTGSEEVPSTESREGKQRPIVVGERPKAERSTHGSDGLSIETERVPSDPSSDSGIGVEKPRADKFTETGHLGKGSDAGENKNEASEPREKSGNNPPKTLHHEVLPVKVPLHVDTDEDQLSTESGASLDDSALQNEPSEETSRSFGPTKLTKQERSRPPNFGRVSR